MNVINVAISDMISQNGDQFFGRVPILGVIFLQIIQQFYSWKTQHLIKSLQKIPCANVKLSQALGSDSSNIFFTYVIPWWNIQKSFKALDNS